MFNAEPAGPDAGWLEASISAFRNERLVSLGEPAATADSIDKPAIRWRGLVIRRKFKDSHGTAVDGSVLSLRWLPLTKCPP